VIDLHSHLLPGIDDGPATVDDALALARAAAAAGTTTMVATPHIDHKWQVDPREVTSRVEQMREALADARIELAVLPGGEVTLTRLTELEPDEVDAVRLGGGPYVLLECPHRSTIGTEFPIAVDHLHRRGERILLAHPERSPVFRRDPDTLAALVSGGVLTSITAASLLGTFGSTVQSFSFRLIREGLVHNVASDSHEAHRRGPELMAGLLAADREFPGFIEHADWLTRAVPEAVLAGSELPPRPELPEPRRGLFARLRSGKSG
jgi:protein-tyrosine phosphatase